MNEYRNDIDMIKGIAILGVIFFHLGIVKSGYLGVDAFLVINGFLIVPSLISIIDSGEFSYLKFLQRRTMRLWPMVILVSAVCLFIGYCGMLPDDYENIGEHVVASNLFSENILLRLTTKDYWNVSNDYNPLMHLWYVGVIFQFYLVFPLLMMGWFRLRFLGWNNIHDSSGIFYFLGILTILSLVIFIGPFGVEGEKFYYLPYRLFEFVTGGIIALSCRKTSEGNVRSFEGITGGVIFGSVPCLFCYFLQYFRVYIVGMSIDAEQTS